MNFVFIAAIASIIATTPLFAGEVAVITFSPENIDSVTTLTINELFYESLEEFGLASYKQVVPAPPCRDKACAFAAAESASAEEVIYCTARVLGSKWIVKAFHYRLGEQKPLSTHTLDCKTIEDFEPVMRRIAEAIVKGKDLEQVASIDNITEQEEDPTRFRRREGFYSFGLQFGYLYPYGSQSYTHWVYDMSTSHEQPFKQIMTTDFINWFELPNNISLQWDLHVGWGAEIGTHLFLLKQFGRNDYSPYAGGGLGIDYCFNGNPPSGIDENKRNSGFSLLGKGGIQLLRTYNFRVHADAGYKYVINDDRDQGPFANIGIMWRKQSRVREQSASSNSSPLVLGMAGIGGLVVLVTLLSLVGSNM